MTRRAGRFVRTTARLLLSLAVAALIPVVAFLAVATFSGWRLLAVSSGSMEPTYPVGSVAVIHPVNVGDIGPGTVIAFVDGGGGESRLVAHRVVQVVDRASGRWLRTQGDANHTPDPQLLPARDVRGRVAWVVPRLGSVARTVGTRGAVVLVALAVIALLPRSRLGASALFRPPAR
jgi:signal peptidase